MCLETNQIEIIKDVAIIRIVEYMTKKCLKQFGDKFIERS